MLQSIGVWKPSTTYSIFPGASFNDYFPGQPGGKNSGIDAPNLFRDMESQYIQAKSYVMGRNHKVYLAIQIPDQTHMYDILDKTLNPAYYSNQEQFEQNILRLDDFAVYNDLIQSEPSNMQFQYDNASTEAQQALQQIQGVVKIIDEERQEEFDLQAGYEYKADKTSPGNNNRDGFYPVRSNMTKIRKDTRKMQQGETFFVNLTANNQKMGLNLMQNTMLIQADTFLQPGLKPLTSNGKVNGQDANYKNLYTNWCFLMETIGDPNYTIEFMFSNNAMPNSTYQLLTGVSPGSEVTFQSSVETAITTFGTTSGGISNEYMDKHTITVKKQHDSLTKEFQIVKSQGNEYIKHAHRKAIVLRPNTIHSLIHIPTAEERKDKGMFQASTILADGYLHLLEQFEFLVNLVRSFEISPKIQSEAFTIFKRINSKCHFITDPYLTIAQLKDPDVYESDMEEACLAREKYLRRVVLQKEIQKAQQNRQELIKLIQIIYKYKYDMV